MAVTAPKTSMFWRNPFWNHNCRAENAKRSMIFHKLAPNASIFEANKVTNAVGYGLGFGTANFLSLKKSSCAAFMPASEGAAKRLQKMHLSPNECRYFPTIYA